MKANRLLAALAAAAWSTVAIALPREAQMPRPAPIVRNFDPVAGNAQCEGCHREIAEEWRQSGHRAAWSSPVFQRALAREPLPFCRGCHAPEANPRRVDVRRGDLGVGCITCHVQDRAVLAVPRREAGLAPHPLAREARFASPAACAACHQFDFPDTEARSAPLAMQRTVTEHAAGQAAATRCAICHMPRVGSHRSHRFAASRDDDMLRKALRVTPFRNGPEIGLDLATTDRVGHAMPTGDLFRRLAVTLGEVDGASTTTYLSRHFESRPASFGASVRVETLDDRPSPGRPQRVHATFAGAETRPLRWRVTYERLETPGNPRRHTEDVVEGKVILAEGVLPP